MTLIICSFNTLEYWTLFYCGLLIWYLLYLLLVCSSCSQPLIFQYRKALICYFFIRQNNLVTTNFLNIYLVIFQQWQYFFICDVLYLYRPRFFTILFFSQLKLIIKIILPFLQFRFLWLSWLLWYFLIQCCHPLLHNSSTLFSALLILIGSLILFCLLSWCISFSFSTLCLWLFLYVAKNLGKYFWVHYNIYKRLLKLNC